MSDPAARPARWAALLSALCLLTWASVAVLGPSAAVPALGAGRVPFDLGLHPSSATVTVLLAVAVVCGGGALAAGLRALARGWRPRRFLLLAVVGAVVLTCVPPVGSADHLSYAAYGRIAALGGDPYSQPPDTFAAGTDPVVSAVRDPWRSTTSVYGPVGGLLMALSSLAGGASVRTTVWAWQLLLLLAWAVVALVARRVLAGDDRARARFHVLFTANPLLLTVGLGGAHADVLAGAAAVVALLLARGRPFWAGVALAVAVGTKAPFGAVAVGIVVAAVAARRCGAAWLARGVGGALLVLVPAHVWAGAHAYDQTRTASRYVSLATIWRPLVEAGVPRGVLLPGLVLVVALVTWLWWPVLVRGGQLQRAAGVTVLLAAGYLLGAAYELPWYDLLLWGPLALVPAPVALTGTAAARLTLLALAYVPGLVDGMSPLVEAVTLGYRREVGPWVAWAALVAVVVTGIRQRRTVEIR
ncbi:DUF2029 domain-containing protein [Kineococcus rhizosphaerae]|uniref:Uncharacterized protein DUF2029 n=1 Tax=Kineococcus rhizosphaerae TaxID=559628 RepID=A0A2T0QWW5_9ACTN|nr:DUF2029 domain-containing protein [Kineococcus rhizosphaerae]PRY10034.1 uncharacterized protein DUF2029 [Kineococcus rhizosphaerae]